MSTLLVASLVVSGAYAQDIKAIEARGYTVQESKGFVFGYALAGQTLKGYMSAPSTGWLAVGFDPTNRMKDANFVFGFVQDGKGVIRDDFGTGSTSHASDESLGGKSDVRLVSFSEADGRTTIEFEVPLASGDRYDRPLSPGTTYKVLWAFGPDNRDNFTAIHRQRGSFIIRF